MQMNEPKAHPHPNLQRSTKVAVGNNKNDGAMEKYHPHSVNILLRYFRA